LAKVFFTFRSGLGGVSIISGERKEC
jgi:hypothetical protein